MVTEVMGHTCTKGEAVTAGNNCRHALLDAVGVCLPHQLPATLTSQLKSVGKEAGLLGRPDHHDHSEELVMSLTVLLFLQDQHELAAEARLKHHPVHRPGEGDVSGQKDNVLPAEGGDALVLLVEVVRDLLQVTLPLTRGSWDGAGVGTELTVLLVAASLAVEESLGAAM